MFLSNVSINRPVMITMLVLVFIVFGALAYLTLSLNLMPDAEFPFITIQTIYPGAGPKEIETQISKKIEDAVSTISKIDYIESYSMDNVSFVIMRFDLDKDVNIASQEAKDKVDAIMNQFPVDAEKPVIGKFDFGAFPIIDMVLSGNLSGRELYEVADKKLKDRFSQIEGVANVNITGGQEREIHVKFDDKVVFQNSISLVQMTQILAAHNLDMPGGQFQQQDQEYSVRLDGELETIKELEELEIPTYFGTKKLKQLASITDSGSEIRKRSIYYNNIDKLKEDNVIKISIIKTSEGNPVDIARTVKKEIPAIKAELPAGSQLVIVDDSSLFIESTVKDTMSNVILGIIFTGFVLLFFLHDLRSTLIVAIAMPTSIISTFLLMQIAGFSLNILSLMGLSTSVGILVTNSVVVLENIFRHMRMGNTRRQAASIGTSEIAVAVIASTLTNIVVFLPLALMKTIAGKFLIEYALTVTFATIFSLLISFTITPMMSSLILSEKQKKNVIGENLEKMFRGWERIYGKLLGKILHNKGRSVLVLVVSFIIFIVTMMTVGPKLGFEFMPTVDEGNIRIDFEIPEGYNLEETAKVYEQIETKVSKYDEVKHLLASIGGQGWIDAAPNIATINVKLVDKEERERSSEEMAGLFIQDLANIPNTKLKVVVESSMGGGGGSAVEFFLMGQEMAELEKYTAELITKAKNIEGLINFDSNLRPGKPEITLIPKREKISQAGTSIYEIALTLRASIEGLVATKYRESGNEYDIKVSLTDGSVDTPEKIKNIPVVTQTGTYRVSQLAEIEFTKGATKIVHRDKYKTVQFTGDLAIGYVPSMIINEMRKAQSEIELPEGYKFKWGGESEMMEENNREMGKAFMIAILLTYMLLAAILESFTKPLLILMTFPLALIGVVLALFLAGQTLNMISMMAIIMLIGIVVNAAILLMDYTQQLREQGKETKQALIEACPTKLKPILMSAVAIILGMLPMAIGIGDSGVEMRQNLGIVSIGGLIVSTFLTLFVIPAFYNLTTKKHLKVVEKV